MGGNATYITVKTGDNKRAHANICAVCNLYKPGVVDNSREVGVGAGDVREGGSRVVEGEQRLGGTELETVMQLHDVGSLQALTNIYLQRYRDG